MDYLIRSISADAYAKLTVLTSAKMCDVARSYLNASPVATAALGRLLTCASLIGCELKSEDASVTLQVNGGGPLGTVLAISDDDGYTRGYVQQPGTELPPKYPGKLDVGGAVGHDGYVRVIKDFGMKEPYVGSVSLASGEIAEDMAKYFAESEQIPTVCSLGVLVSREKGVLVAGGFLLQLLPGAPESTIDLIEGCMSDLPSVTDMFSSGETPEDIALKRFVPLGFTVTEKREVGYRCNCSRQRVSKALISLGREELQKMIDEDHGCETTCRFCDKVYRFSSDELSALLRSATRK